MDSNEIGLIKLELIHKLMTMYCVGTGKKPNHKNESGDYEIIDFVKHCQPVLKSQGLEITLEDDHEFIEKFFNTLFEHVK